MEATNKKDISLVELITRTVDLIRFLIKKWLIILIVGFVFGLAGVFYAWQKKPVYIAEMTFVTDNDGGSKLGVYAGLAAQFGVDLGGGNSNIFEGDNLVELLLSKELIKTTLLSPYGDKKDKLFIDEYLEFNRLKESWGKDVRFKNIHFSLESENSSREADSVLQNVCERIKKSELQVFRKDKKLSLIISKMNSGNEVFAKRFLEMLAINAIQYYTDYKSKKSRQNVAILQKQVDSVRQILFGNISEVAAINDLNVNPIKQALRSGAQRKQVDVQVNGALYTELLKNLEMAKMLLRKETPLIQVIDKPILPLEKKKPGRLFTGITFAIFGGVIIITFLLLKRWVNNQQIFIKKN